MVTCIHCKGKSKVVLSRKISLDGTNTTMTRTRQCLTCRWKWKTIEVQTEIATTTKVPTNVHV